MKNIRNIFLLFCVLFSLSSCIYTDDTYSPRPIYPHYYPTINAYSYFQRGNVVDINFVDTYVSGRDYYFLMIESSFGAQTINGRRWVKVSDEYWTSPVSVFVDYFHIFPNRNYRCIIMSSWGEYSQEFNMYVY